MCMGLMGVWHGNEPSQAHPEGKRWGKPVTNILFSGVWPSAMVGTRVDSGILSLVIPC